MGHLCTFCELELSIPRCLFFCFFSGNAASPSRDGTLLAARAGFPRSSLPAGSRRRQTRCEHTWAWKCPLPSLVLGVNKLQVSTGLFSSWRRLFLFFLDLWQTAVQVYSGAGVGERCHGKSRVKRLFFFSFFKSFGTWTVWETREEEVSCFELSQLFGSLGKGDVAFRFPTNGRRPRPSGKPGKPTDRKSVV